MASPHKNIVSAIRETLNIELQEGLSPDELRKIIAGYINPLITNNFNKLISILYRLDINESKLKQLLTDNPAEDAGMIIADLIIERQIQKLKSRAQFHKKGENNIDENEKW
jgi:molybdopterin-biosynthesis enzyme MoeA-like protein